MNQKRIPAALLVIGLLTIGPIVGAEAAGTRRQPARGAKPNSALAGQAKVSMQTAKTTALAKVPGGKFKAGELERENGKLIYSFEIVVAGKSGIEEVNVDAISGKVLSVAHEGVRAESKEARQEGPEAHRTH